MLTVTKPLPTSSIVRIIIVMLAVVFNSLPTGAAVSNFHGISINSERERAPGSTQLNWFASSNNALEGVL
jgi:hypothetical protein